ncbi:hypothetical protein D3C76_1235400 [compost metagenome]
MSDSKLGVWKHGAFKTFLTRGAFRSVFRPMLFTNEEHFHIDFITIFNDAARKIDTSVMSGKTLTQWLVLAPLRFFENNFLSDETGNSLVPLLQEADRSKAVQSAHFTQAFALWYFQQSLTNDEKLAETLGYDMELVEDALVHIYGMKNLTLDYLNYFREKFDLEALEVDPRDWPLVYYYDLCDMLYSSEQKLNVVIGEWNDDLIARTQYSTLAVTYFSECKKTTLAIAEMG